MKPPVESVKIKMLDETIFDQVINFEFYPSVGPVCKRMGHAAPACKSRVAAENTKKLQQADDGWTTVRGRKRNNSKAQKK